MSPAMPGTPIVIAGTTMRGSKNPPHPEQGIRSVLRHPTHRSAGTVTMIGIDMRTSAIVTAVGSCHLPCLWAMKNPSGRPMLRLMIIAAIESCAETHIFGTIMSRTGWPINRRLSPKSPRKKPYM